LFGSAGAHLGWVVPVVYDTSPPLVGKAPATGKSATASAKQPLKTSTSASGTGASLDEVSVTGTRYFFWFSSDTLSAVTRQIDLCP
jgi:hypothetical protein